MGLFGGISKALFGGASTGGAEEQARLARERQQAATDYAQGQITPYADVGRQGLSAIEQALGFGGDASAENYGFLNKRFGADNIETDPSYQFRLNEGLKAQERALAAQGKTMSPEAVKALTNYGQQAASQEYGAAYDRFSNDQTNIYNRLMGITNMGQNQAANLGNLELGNAAEINNIATNLENLKISAAEADANRGQGIFNTLVGGGASLWANR